MNLAKGCRSVLPSFAVASASSGDTAASQPRKPGLREVEAHGCNPGIREQEESDARSGPRGKIGGRETVAKRR